MPILRKILKFFGVCVVLAAFLWLAMQLFFPEKYEQYVAPYLSRFVSQNQEGQAKIEKEKLVIAFAKDVDVLDPTSMDPGVRNRLLQIYEPLVLTDSFWNVLPGLASSYGQIDDKTWEFRLRRNAQFHNSKLLTADDVIASIDRAKNFADSQMKNIVGSITAEASGTDKVVIKTDFPDPLILQKLSFILIMPKEFADEVAPKLIGTGPYKFSNKQASEMSFIRYDGYWGGKSTARNLLIKVIPDKEARIKALTSHEIDILGDVPPTYIESLNRSKVSVVTMPSYEVTFLLFDMKSPVFSNKDFRKAVAMSIDKKRFMLSTVGYTREVNQFVSSGVFGFDQSIKPISYDPKTASETVGKVSDFESIPVKFVVPEGMVDTAKEIFSMLKQVGFDVSLISKKSDDFEKSLGDNEGDIYLMGWKSDIADANDFVQSVIHTKDEKKSLGMYNAGEYSNPALDKIIEESMREINMGKRLKTLHEIMKVVAEDDVIGVPLFETQVIYGVSENVTFTPRADGYILAKDITQNSKVKSQSYN
ncbi:hypothetical protein HZA39_04745 [Candidatus Peregrinibacteria bacterium]|nr:hypothetical protein [Candidatus Peregrinibacteria bacterium]